MMSRAEEVAQQLTGTAQELRDVATAAERDDHDFCSELDCMVFQCDICGWWCDIDEENESGEGQICDDCKRS